MLVKVIAYSGDNSWTDVLIPLSENPDVFISKCSAGLTRLDWSVYMMVWSYSFNIKIASHPYPEECDRATWP